MLVRRRGAFPRVDRLRDRLVEYLAALRWPTALAGGGEEGITWLELALDFEAWAQAELPYRPATVEGQRQRGRYQYAEHQGAEARSPAPIGARARLMADAVRSLGRMAWAQF